MPSKKILHFQQQWRSWQYRIFFGIVVVLFLWELSKSQNREWLISAFYSTTVSGPEPTILEDPAREVPPLPGLDFTLLDSVEDNTFLAENEADAWNHLIDLLEKTKEKELKEHTLGMVSYQQLSELPKSYRGKLVRVTGIAARAYELKQLRVPINVPSVYEIWLKMDGSPPGESMVVYTLSLPEGFPLERDIRERISFVGFFYKVSIYAPEVNGKPLNRTAFSPMLLAKTLHWEPNAVQTSQTPAEPEPPPPFLLVFSFALMVSGIGVWIYLSRIPKNKSLHEGPLPEKFSWGDEESEPQS